MKRQLKRTLLVVLVSLCVLAFPAADAAASDKLPGQELWQPYLDKTSTQMESFAQDPLSAFLELLPDSPVGLLTQMLHSYSDVILFLILTVVLAFLIGETQDRAFLDLAAACGCGVLLWNDLIELARSLCEKMTGWKNFLLGFLPVYGGVLTVSGEVNAGSAASGFLLSGLCLIAQGVELWAEPLLKSYLIISIACGISTQGELSAVCRATGSLLQKGLLWAGKAFALLLGLQRIITVQLDHTTSRLGQLLTTSIPVVGQALGSASEMFLSGMRLLKSSLGIAAILIVGAEFAPLYLGLLIHILLLSALKLLVSLGGNKRCEELLGCFVQAVQCMAAVTAVFFELIITGVLLMALMGGS